MIQRDTTLPVTTKCHLLAVNRSTAYYQTSGKPIDPEELALKRIIDELHMKHPFMGTRSIRDQLRMRGYKINRKRVKRLMDEIGIASTAHQPSREEP